MSAKKKLQNLTSEQIALLFESLTEEQAQRLLSQEALSKKEERSPTPSKKKERSPEPPYKTRKRERSVTPPLDKGNRLTQEIEVLLNWNDNNDEDEQLVLIQDQDMPSLNGKIRSLGEFVDILDNELSHADLADYYEHIEDVNFLLENYYNQYDFAHSTRDAIKKIIDDYNIISDFEMIFGKDNDDDDDDDSDKIFEDVVLEELDNIFNEGNNDDDETKEEKLIDIFVDDTQILIDWLTYTNSIDDLIDGWNSEIYDEHVPNLLREAAETKSIALIPENFNKIISHLKKTFNFEDLSLRVIDILDEIGLRGYSDEFFNSDEYQDYIRKMKFLVFQLPVPKDLQRRLLQKYKVHRGGSRR